MAPVTTRRSRVDDDDDLSLYDPEWLARGKKVVRDGGVVRTSIMLMDGVPNPRLMLNDASMHRPHQVGVVDSAQMRDAQREAARSYEARNDFLRDAWRGSSAPPLLAVRDSESARDAWIRQLGEAWRASPDLPARDPEDDDDPKAAATAVETQRRRWNAESPTKDAALTDRDASYGEYIQRLTTA
jgi:hypothetical protein